MFDRRVHILLDHARYSRLESEARSRKVSVAEVVREAIDAAHPPRWSERNAAGDAILSAAPMAVPQDVDELKAELDGIRGRRA